MARRLGSMLLLGLMVCAGCVREGLLYPGDEYEVAPPGYGRAVLGVDEGLTLHTLDLCLTGGSCTTVGPFMRTQAVYVLQLPVGQHCLSTVKARTTGDIDGGGSGMGYIWHAKDGAACFTISESRMVNLGSFTVVNEGGEGRLSVEQRPGLGEAARHHYPGL